MAFDFDRIVDRRGSNSMKWNVGEKELPMWVADMDFETAPAVREALSARVAHGVFGYSDIPDSWVEAYIGWWKERHGFEMQPEWLIFTTGVIPAISTAVRKLTTPAEKIVVQTPVYNIFFNSILNNGRVPLENRLTYDGEKYAIDFADLEEKLADPQTTLMILCNPHNPVGAIWDRETLAAIGTLCKKHHVTVLSDEIHCDLTDPGFAYVPFASASDICREISVTCMAPTKAFNIAGLQTAAVCVPNEALRFKMNRALNTDEVAEPNAFAIDAAVAAFTRDGPWLDALRAYLADNKAAVYDFLQKELPDVHCVPQHATYLLWLDCSQYTEDTDALAAFIRAETGLYLAAGSQYHGNGNRFLRLNAACPRAVLTDGLHGLKAALDAYPAR